MHLLHFKSWSWSWIPGGASVWVANLSPSPWLGRAQHFLFDGRRDDARPGSKAGPWEKSRQSTDSQPPGQRERGWTWQMLRPRSLQRTKKCNMSLNPLNTVLRPPEWGTGLPKTHAALWDNLPLGPASLSARRWRWQKTSDVMNSHLNVKKPPTD